jgi:hypothetical protein
MDDESLVQCFGVIILALFIIGALGFGLWLVHRDLDYYIARVKELSNRLDKLTDVESMEKKEQEFVKKGWIDVRHDD